MLTYWKALVLVQTLISFEKTCEDLTKPNLAGILAPSPKIFYVNTTGRGNFSAKAKNKISTKSDKTSCLLDGDNSTVPALRDAYKNFHAKKFSEPTVHGNWGSWGEFGPPSKTCDEGLRFRRRKCNNPAPQAGGKACVGEDSQSVLFELGRCVLKDTDTEFKRFNMGSWKHLPSGTPGFYWKVKFGNAGSKDATGDGYYLVADSSAPRQRKDEAVIISTILTPAAQVNRACLKFAYRMSGPGMGSLSVKISRNSRNPKEIWKEEGDHGSGWVKAKVTLKSSVKFQVLFVAAIGTPGQSDIALDNIYVDNGRCNCQDAFLSCDDWAKKGMCEDKNAYYWMATNCKASCKTCGCKNEARTKDCHHWAEDGYCSKPLYRQWMSANCRLSCKLCACRDYLNHKECQRRVGAYECETQPKWMADNCKLSCGFCDCRNIANDIDCYHRMIAGDCEKDPIYMASNCKYTCEYCSCNDRYGDCAVWAARGQCAKNSAWMHAYCTLSCGKCKCHDSDPRCQEWWATGECQKNPLYMNAFCQKTCQICEE